MKQRLKLCEKEYEGMKITLTQNEAKYMTLIALGLGADAKFRRDSLISMHEVEIIDDPETGLDQSAGQGGGCAEGFCKCKEGLLAETV